MTAESAQSTLIAFLDRRATVIAVLLLVAACIRIVSTYDVFSYTNDEPLHFACGLEYLVNHTYKFETQHPPLTRALIALLPYFDGARPRGLPNFHEEGWTLLSYQNHPERTLFLMRLGNLPFFILGGLVVFLWARRYFSGAIASIAVLCYTLLPAVLAHAGLATTDMGLAAVLGAAFLSMCIWAEEPTYKHAMLFGTAAALAVLSKFTALGFLPTAAALAMAGYVAIERPGFNRLIDIARHRALSLALAAVTGAFLCWAAFFFSWGPVPGGHITLPAPDFFAGIQEALKHNREGHSAYLFGRHNMHGWWYYFPVALAIKSPLAFLLLLPIGVLVCWNHRGSVAHILPLAFSLGVLLPAMASNVNIGVRHVLPVYLGFSIIAALGLNHLVRWFTSRRWVGALALVLTLWLASTGILQHPDYIPYFNELVRDRENALVDSDYDWGQDTKRLAARLRQLGATSVNYGYVQAYEEPFLERFPGLPHIVGIHPLQPAVGWTAVSPTMNLTVQYGLEYRYPNLRPWFEYVEPRERVGTIVLYYLPPGVYPKAPR